MLFSTFLGGGGLDQGTAIAVDAVGNVYVAGITSATDFPTQGALQTALRGASDAFVTKIALATVSLMVAPASVGAGQTLTWTVQGAANQFFAIEFSRQNSGATLAGQPLALGPDFGLVTVGRLDAAGRGSFSLAVPPGTSSGTYHFQAATAADAGFSLFLLSNGASVTVR